MNQRRGRRDERAFDSLRSARVLGREFLRREGDKVRDERGGTRDVLGLSAETPLLGGEGVGEDRGDGVGGCWAGGGKGKGKVKFEGKPSVRENVEIPGEIGTFFPNYRITVNSL